MRSLAIAIALSLAAAATAGSQATDPVWRPGEGTFSIVAYDSVTGELGVAVESRALAVATRVAWARARIGAVATQASTNESFGPRGLGLLARGLDAQATLDSLLASDPGREQRQIGVVAASGSAASFTGTACSPWAGGIVLPGLAAQGNILAGEAVVREMERAFRETQGELAEKLLAALQAGQAAGGDKRGQQSAALLVVRPSDEYPEYEERYVSLRVDDHPTPIAELVRLYRLFEATDLAEAHVRYAEAYARAGRTGDAQRERERVEQTLHHLLADPKAPASALNALAWLACSNGFALDDAMIAADRAAVLDPKHPEVLDTAAECRFRRREFVSAARMERLALALDPDDPHLKSQLAKFEKAARSKPKHSHRSR